MKVGHCQAFLLRDPVLKRVLGFFLIKIWLGNTVSLVRRKHTLQLYVLYL